MGTSPALRSLVIHRQLPSAKNILGTGRREIQAEGRDLLGQMDNVTKRNSE